MSADVPSWLAPPATVPSPPAWLAPIPPIAPFVPIVSKEWAAQNRKVVKAAMFQEFEMVFPRVLDMMCGGHTLTKALKEVHIPVDRGAFMAWIRKDAQRYARFREAKEIRTEVYAGEIVKHALGENDDGSPMIEELDRSKFIVDTYKFLMKADNKKEYGDTKSFEVTQTISIRAALEAAQSRVSDIIDVDVIDDEIESYKQLSAGDDEVDDDD